MIETTNISTLKIEQIMDWLTTKGMKAQGISHLIDGFIQQLNKQGFGIFRAAVLMKTLHPQIEMLYYSWKTTDLKAPGVTSHFAMGTATYQFANSAVDKVTFQHGGARGSEGFLKSPFKYLDDGEKWIHCPLSESSTDYDYPILNELKAIGATDYFAAALNTQSEQCHLSNQISWSTNKSGGFTSAELAAFKRIADYFALCLEMHLNRYITETLLSVYLGEHSGKNVLNGKIQRGDVEVLNAAIWFSDLRGFTCMSQEFNSETLVGWLNDYFETISRVILQHDGEILKFVGDAVLAIFPIYSAPEKQTVCRQALQAARNANNALQAINTVRAEQSLPLLAHGIALHEGDVQYGNIGALQRLDFTVIGQAVNLTSRLEGLCSELHRTILVSEGFASNIAGNVLQSVGEFQLKGVVKPQQVFAMVDE